MEMLLFSESGRKQLAARIWSPVMMTAPSCSGVLTMKMLRNSDVERMPSMAMPVSMYSLRPFSRVTAMSTPVREALAAVIQPQICCT